MIKRVLVTGASGMLGYSLSKFLKNYYDVYRTDVVSFDECNKFLKFDLEKDDYELLLEWSNPDLIIHCAALTNGNYCQNNPIKAFEINSFSTYKLLKHSKLNTKIIYISTDAVFSSSNKFPNEKTLTNPENIYGKSKELGEFFVLNSNRDFLILRTTIVGKNFLDSKNGFVEWIINSVKKNENVTLFSDVIFNPISIWDFINEIYFLISNGNFYNNIFNICGNENITKFDFGLELIREFNLNESYIVDSKISDFSLRAKRSNDQSLDCSKYLNLTKRILPKLSQTIKSIKENYNV